MDLRGVLSDRMERSSAGSEATSQRVISMLSGVKNALYFGDECVTPGLLKAAGCEVTALITDEARAEKAGAKFVKGFELPENAADYDVIWYNGIAELEQLSLKLQLLKERCKKGGRVVFRALCWLIDPSPDTKSYCRKRFGIIEPLDRVLLYAKQAGFAVEDFYIAPRSDWTENYYRPLLEAAQELTETSGMDELKKEADMFELHCEEYSYVYYILKG